VRSVPVVVVIERETELGRVIRDALVDEGYDVVRVRDQYGAVGVMRRQPVDLVVAGLPSPEKEAPGPLSELVDEFPDVALISLSVPGAAARPVFSAWRQEGRHIMMRQPFRIDDVVTAANELVG